MSGIPPPPSIPREPTDADLAVMGLKMLQDMIGDIVARSLILRTAPDQVDRDHAIAIHRQATTIYKALERIT